MSDGQKLIRRLKEGNEVGWDIQFEKWQQYCQTSFAEGATGAQQKKAITEYGDNRIQVQLAEDVGSNSRQNWMVKWSLVYALLGATRHSHVKSRFGIEAHEQ